MHDFKRSYKNAWNKFIVKQNFCASSWLIKKKGKAVPLQAWTGPEGSYEVKVPRFRDNGTRWL